VTSLKLKPLVANPFNAHYEGEYDAREIEWRALNAIDKADNIVATLGDHRREIGSVVEVGCGTGAVLLALSRVGLGTSHRGFDLADPNAHIDPEVLAAGIALETYDGSVLPLADDSVDLIYATHVLEHVEDERGFLRELARVARHWIYIEVPCELNMRMNAEIMQSTLDIGHINAYTPDSLALTLTSSGLEPIDVQIFDHSMAIHAFDGSALAARAKAAIRRTLLSVSPSFASKVFTYHVGALCRPGPRR